MHHTIIGVNDLDPAQFTTTAPIHVQGGGSSTLAVKSLAQGPNPGDITATRTDNTTIVSPNPFVAIAVGVRGTTVCQLGNIQIRIPTTGNVSLQYATIVGSATIMGSGDDSWNNLSMTTGSALGTPASRHINATATTTWTHFVPTDNYPQFSREHWIVRLGTSQWYDLLAQHADVPGKCLLRVERLV